MKKWECAVCGYIHIGEEPPDECPVCGSDKSQFFLISDETPTVSSVPPVEEVKKNSRPIPPPEPRYKIPFIEKYFKFLQALSAHPFAALLSKFHAHPIMVHIPNGVLPLSLLFTLLALILQNPQLAAAAKWNMLFVFLSMPVVLFTGILDWISRYKAKTTRVFSIKLVCGGVVFLVSGILSVWWIVQPEVYLSRSGSGVFFVFLYLIDFFAAALAGWNGGKLVFHTSTKK